MPQISDEEFLENVNKFIQKYEWRKASTSYEKYYDYLIKQNNFFKAAQLKEKIGYCYYRYAYQSPDSTEFSYRLGLASKSYEEAGDTYQKTSISTKIQRIESCKINAEYLKSLKINNPTQKIVSLDDTIIRAKKILKFWEDTEEYFEYSKTCNDFLMILSTRLDLSFKWNDAKEIIEEAIKYGKISENLYSKHKSKHELARTYYYLGLFLTDRPQDVYESIKKQTEIADLSFSYTQKAYNLAKEINDEYLIGLSLGLLAYNIIENTSDFNKGYSYGEVQLAIGDKLNDVLIKAYAYEVLSYSIMWKSISVEDNPDKLIKSYEKSTDYADKSISLFSIINKNVVMAYISHLGSIYLCSQSQVNDNVKKRFFLEKDRELSEKDLKHSEKYGSKLGYMYIKHDLSRALYGLYKLEKDDNIKNKLLNKAIKEREEQIELSKIAQPFRYWNLGVMHNNLAQLKNEKARNEEEIKYKKKYIYEAINDIKKCIELCTFYARERRVYKYNVPPTKVIYGQILEHMYSINKDEENIKTAIDVYKENINFYKKNELLIRMAELQWKISILYDKLKEYTKSSEEFELASNNYRIVAEKTPSLREFYMNYSYYMNVWSIIEKAKYYHSLEDYENEHVFYLKAADILKTLPQWAYLYQNFYAWAKLADAENQSRNERINRAKDLFIDTANLFKEVEVNLNNQLKFIDDKSEARMVSLLFKASKKRNKYCLARADVEHAKSLKREGKYIESSEKFAIASKNLQNISESLGSKSEQLELEPIIILCKAWELMILGEYKLDPSMYKEASELFIKVRNVSQNHKMRLLASGHHYFCKALESGLLYESSKDSSLYQVIIQDLTNAANYYVRAGFSAALDYSRATQRLFEGYMYIENATGETDLKEKSKWLSMAEKVLIVSSELFTKAMYNEKRTQVNILLEDVKKERQLAYSLHDIFNAPSISSTTSSFTLPSPSHEYPVGLERFDYANLQASIILKSETFIVGERIDVHIEIFNTGRSSASLIKMVELVPESYHITKVSGFYQFDEGILDLRGRRISPLKTEEIIVQIQPFSKGENQLKPIIYYTDETGETKMCKPHPVNVYVREMGLFGWLRGLDNKEF